ncbi:alpha/beta hydrolase [Pseudonocardia sp. NPDC049154]|uniref:alpha/beta hydrolase n=1 Tax=Pseudonocardia sp. NPDC049154 TaxID=3155501 RepID=UPI0034017B20
MSDEPPVLHLPAREIPVPGSVSAEAQAVIIRGNTGPPYEFPPQPWPAREDAEGWRSMAKGIDEALLRVYALRPKDMGVDIEERRHEDALVYVARPPGDTPDDRRVLLDLHGGGFLLGAGEMCQITTAGAAVALGVTVWGVDYRMPPDHPFPAPLDDCVAAYRALLAEHEPSEIVLAGTSAGSNLAAATLLRAQDEGLPMPAGLVLRTPLVDMTLQSDSVNTNLGLDNVLVRHLGPLAEWYVGLHDPRNPYLSPIFGEFGPEWPPTLLTTGTRDILLSDTVRLHRALRRAGAHADLHVFEAAGHTVFMGATPEDAEHRGVVRAFAEERWAAS